MPLVRHDDDTYRGVLMNSDSLVYKALDKPPGNFKYVL